jgi:hypothetical protein
MSDEVKTPSGSQRKYEWDFFLAHAGADLPDATTLYHKLTPPAAVFLDEVCLVPGDDWPEVLPAAQRSSLISVILVSPNSDQGYYDKEEIAAAIQMARDDPRTHRVVPVYFKAKEIPNDKIPYGLRPKHSLYVPDSGDLSEIGERLLATLDVMRQYEEKKGEIVAAQRIAVEKIVSKRSGTEVLSGLGEVTKVVRPFLYMLIFLLVVMLALTLVAALTPSDLRLLLVTTFASVSVLLLGFILWFTARSFSYALQIVPGRINGG